MNVLENLQELKQKSKFAGNEKNKDFDEILFFFSILNVDELESIIQHMSETVRNHKLKFSATTQKIFWSSLYLLLIIGVCLCSVTVFDRFYFSSIYVSGESMSPTLNHHSDGRVDFGIIDTHLSARKNIERFNIVTTYYPWSDYTSDVSGNDTLKVNATYKIKRIIALPGETFRIVDNNLQILNLSTNTFENIEIKFSRTIENLHNYPQTTLNAEEYWVMGDNWDNSQDCIDSGEPVRFEDIVGVLVSINGTCQIQGSGADEKCVNHQYTFPRYF